MENSRGSKKVYLFAAVALMVLTVPALTLGVTSDATYSFTIHTSARGEFGSFNQVITRYPVTFGFSSTTNLSASTYFWQFGDGTNSTVAAPSHTFNLPCDYDISVKVSDSAGNANFGYLYLGLFDAQGPSGAIAVCPPSGTAGFIPTKLAGGYFASRAHVNIKMNGTSIRNVTTDQYGHFELDLNSTLYPAVNGTKFVFTTNPTSLVRAFTTLEGIRATPIAGVPGDAVTIEGRSYSSGDGVMIYLGGAYLGQGQADGSGSFTTVSVIPASAPLTSIGLYPYSTTPPILGTGANYNITANTLGSELLSWWWLILLLLLILILIAYYVRRRLRQRRLRMMQLGSATGIPQPEA